MIDKIDNSHHLGGNQIGGADKRQAGNANVSTLNTSGAANVETLSLTDQASKLQSIEQNLGQLSMMDSNRVATARTAIADGTYTIDPLAIANKLIDFETALYGDS